jgi:ActR/RegA family two-component response regulator
MTVRVGCAMMIVMGEMNRTLLVLDDDARLRKAAVRALASTCTVVTASTAGEAIEAAKRLKFDVALVDVILREGSGIDALLELRTLQPDLVAIVMSGLGCAATVRRAFQAGALDFIEKPFSWPDVLSSLEQQTPVERGRDDIPPFENVKWEYYNRIIVAFGGNVSRAAAYAGLRRTSLQRIKRRRPNSS